MAGFRRRVAFDREQSRPQGAPNLELFAMTFGVVRQQQQLVQCLLKLPSGFHHSMVGGRPVAGGAPAGNGFCKEASLGVMPREKFRMAVYDLGEASLDRFGNLGVQCSAWASQ